MIQFYCADIRENPELGPEETLHCIKVLRKKVGDRIFVTDGKGNRYECEITSIAKQQVKLEILDEEKIEKGWEGRITLAIAPTKNSDRMAWLIEKATEIGVDEIQFISCRYSERRNVNVERLRRNAISAMNQSLKTRLPEIKEIKPIGAIESLKGEKYFGYCSQEFERLEFVKNYIPGRDVIIAIGPEGDFSPEEAKSLVEKGYKAVTFGNERLRTETAALYGLTAVHVIDEYEK